MTREDAIQVLQAALTAPFIYGEYADAIGMAIEALSADRPTGEWIFNPKDAIDLMFAKPKCSKCGFESSDGGNFCPNCGADMRGKEECKLPNNCGEWRPIDKPKAGWWARKVKTDEHGSYWWRECSECGRKPLLNRWNHGEDLSDYCPNCGAKMKGGDDE